MKNGDDLEMEMSDSTEMGGVNLESVGAVESLKPRHLDALMCFLSGFSPRSFKLTSPQERNMIRILGFITIFTFIVNMFIWQFAASMLLQDADKYRSLFGLPLSYLNGVSLFIVLLITTIDIFIVSTVGVPINDIAKNSKGGIILRLWQKILNSGPQIILRIGLAFIFAIFTSTICIISLQKPTLESRARAEAVKTFNSSLEPAEKYQSDELNRLDGSYGAERDLNKKGIADAETDLRVARSELVQGKTTLAEALAGMEREDRGLAGRPKGRGTAWLEFREQTERARAVIDAAEARIADAERRQREYTEKDKNWRERYDNERQTILESAARRRSQAETTAPKQPALDILSLWVELDKFEKEPGVGEAVSKLKTYLTWLLVSLELSIVLMKTLFMPDMAIGFAMMAEKRQAAAEAAMRFNDTMRQKAYDRYTKSRDMYDDLGAGVRTDGGAAADPATQPEDEEAERSRDARVG